MLGHCLATFRLLPGLWAVASQVERPGWPGPAGRALSRSRGERSHLRREPASVAGCGPVASQVERPGCRETCSRFQDTAPCLASGAGRALDLAKQWPSSAAAEPGPARTRAAASAGISIAGLFQPAPFFSIFFLDYYLVGRSDSFQTGAHGAGLWLWACPVAVPSVEPETAEYKK